VKPQSSNTYAKADAQLDHIARLYIEAKVEAEAADAALKEMAIAIKEAIADGEGVKGQGWLATWKQNKPSVKVDWKSVAEVFDHVAPDTYAEAVKRATTEQPGARVFRVFGKEDAA
jgi:hypothetical protein